VNCGLLAPLIPEGARVADLGSGAGLPGLVLALARPDLEVTLIEPMARRVDFLTDACARLGLTTVTVVRGRAEESAGSGSFDVVTSRALAPLPRLLTWSLPLVAVNGVVLAMKGSAAAAEIEQAGPVLARWAAEASVVVCEAPGSSPTTVVRVVPGRDPGLGWPTTATTRHRRRERR
jgi:16S rRNA (guanine527-N7)-methyltransferase